MTARSSSPRPDGRARRPVPGLPELLRHARLRPADQDRARAGAPVRQAAAHPVHRPRRRAGRHRPHRGSERSFDGEPVDFLDGTVFSPDRGLPDARVAGPTQAPYTSDYTGQQIYYRSIQQRVGRLPDRPRLPVALGHGLVLVLAGVRRAEPADPPGLAAEVAAQQRLLEDGRVRGPAPRDGAGSTPGAVCRRASGSSRTSRSRSTGLADFLRWFDREVPIEPVWLCPIQLRDNGAHRRRGAGLAALPAGAGTALRQRRLLVHRGRSSPDGPTATSTG